MEKSLIKCPDLQEIELLAIDNSQVNTNLTEHFKNCPNCRRQYDEFVHYYQLLQEEMALPISNAVVSFIQEIEAERILLSVLRLHPVENESQVNPAFRCELVHQNLQDTTFIEFPDINSDEILIRLLQDPVSRQGCVVLLAKATNLYQNVKLYFRQLNLAIPVDEHGLGKIDGIEAESLKEQIVEIMP